MTFHLGHNWYRYELPPTLKTWIEDCINEYVDISANQPYDTVYLRAKKDYNGNRTYKLVFSHSWQHNGKKYRFPVCYLLDLNIGKFKGNRMSYYIDNLGHLYCNEFPIYNERFKFHAQSKFNREKRELIYFLKNLEIPEPMITRHRRRQLEKRHKQKRITNAKIARKKVQPKLNRINKRQRLIRESIC